MSAGFYLTQPEMASLGTMKTNKLFFRIRAERLP